MGPAFTRKYGVLLVTGATAIRIPVLKRNSADYALTADWTPAPGDVAIKADAAAAANITNLPTFVVMGNTGFWEFILTAAELTCKQLIVMVGDAAVKAVEDQAFLIETFGNASAMYQADLSAAALPADLNKILGTTLTETVGGYLAAAFKKLFDVVTPIFTAASANQTGDSYALANGVHGFVAIDNEIATLNANATSILNAVTSITTNTARTKLILPDWMEIPDAGTQSYELDVNLYNLQGVWEDADTNAVTIHARKADGTSLDSLLSSTAMTRTGVGRYKVTFAFLSTQAEMQVLFDVSYTVGAVGAGTTGTVSIVDAETSTLLLAIKAKVDQIVGTPAVPGDKMNLIDAPNITAIAAIQNGLSASVATAVWGAGTRTLTSFGTLVNDTATAVWNFLTSAIALTGSIGKLLKDNLPVSFTGGDATLANQNAILARLNAAQLTVISPVLPDGTLCIVAGDDYKAADGTALQWTLKVYSGPSIVGATVSFSVAAIADYNAGDATPTLRTASGSIAMVGADAVITVELPAAATALLRTSPPDDAFNYVYMLRVTLSGGDVLSKALGAMTVQQPVA